MITKKPLKIRLVSAIFGCFFGILGLISPIFATATAYADEENQTDNASIAEGERNEAGELMEPIYIAPSNSEESEKEAEEPKKETKTCDSSLGSLGWLVCPTTGKISEAVDWLYDKNKDLLEINPVVADEESPIYLIWQYFLGIANLAFVIFLLIAIYSQITGVGISNYGIKKALPKLIIAAIMVNLSFIVCSLAVDVSNIIGNGLRGVFTAIEEATIPDALTLQGQNTAESAIAMGDMYMALAGGGSITSVAGLIAFEGGEIWLLIPAALGALVAVVIGLITIALRQVVVILLIMIAPLAIVAYILPNTESLFKKWKDLLVKMLVFYPAYSLLFGASSLAGWAIISSAKDGFGLILGVAVQIFPLFFSWSLMKMSGTFLGTVNAKLTGLFARPLASNRAWAESHRAQTNAYYMQYGRTPYSHLRRYLSNRKELREQNTSNLLSIRKSEANIYTQRKISGGYDGTKAKSNSGVLKANKYTHAAKDAANTGLASQMAELDTKHAIDNYGNYYVKESLREGIKEAEKKRDAKALEGYKIRDAEYNRAAIGAHNFLEYSRAKMTAENDAEADFNFMVDEFINATVDKMGNLSGRDPANLKRALDRYNHFIVSSAGGLGEVGQSRVLGKIIAQAASVESNQRRDINIIANKFPHDKRNFRNMVVGYYVDDDGFATDKDGNKIEKVRGYLKTYHPEELVLWDGWNQDDPNGPYYDWYDTNGNYVTRIYKKDSSAIKELLSNFDTPINDPINNLYAELAATKENKNSEYLKYIGLDKYRTTIGRALQSAPFKEKNAAFSPMVAEMVKKGYPGNYAQLNIAYLDSLNKATKPGAFNTQDSDAIKTMTALMDPEQWDMMFPEELIRGYKNVNGEPICGFRYDFDQDGKIVRDENGKAKGHKIPEPDATYEELMNQVKEKYIIPASKKIVAMMSRQTPNTADNQKAGTAADWQALKEVFDKKWVVEGNNVNLVGADPVYTDPYRQNGDTRAMGQEMRQDMYKVDENGEKVYSFRGKGGKTNTSNENGNRRVDGRSTISGEPHVNHHAEVFDIYNRSLTAEDFSMSFQEYCDNYPELEWVKTQFQDYIIQEAYNVHKEDLYDYANELLTMASLQD